MWVLVMTVLAVVVVTILVSRRTRAREDRPWMLVEQVLGIGAFAWSVGVGMYLVFMPLYYGSATEATCGFAERMVTRRQTLLEVNGLSGVVFLLIPVLLTALPCLPRKRAIRRHLLVAGSLLLLAFVTVGTLSVGLFYTPSALAMLVTTALVSCPGNT